MHSHSIYLYGLCKGIKYHLTMKGVTLSHLWHKGHKRDDGSDYFIHPLMVSNSLFNLNNPEIVTDVVGAASLLHDSIEDERVSYETVVQEFGKEVADLVLELTKSEGEQDEEHLKRVKDPRAILIKGEDRRWNLVTMVILVVQSKDHESFEKNLNRLEKYVQKTEDPEKGVLALLKDGRRRYLAYSDAFVTIRDEIQNIIDVIKPYIEEVKKRMALEKRVVDLEQELKKYQASYA